MAGGMVMNTKKELLEALEAIKEKAEDAQGDWLPVELLHCPDWVDPFREITKMAEEALNEPKGKPLAGDYVRLKDDAGNLIENHIEVRRVRQILHNGRYMVEDQTGESFAITRYPEGDNDIRRAWQEVLYRDLKEGEKL